MGSWKGDNSNPAPNPIQQNSNVSDIKSVENRAENIRRDSDNNKDFNVTLLDIDTTIFDYVDKTINIHVLDNSNNIKVPVMYASPERWKTVQQDGALRDGQGKLQFPLIAFSRKSVAKKQEMMSPNRHLSYPIIRKFSEKNKYDSFSLMNGTTSPVNQIYSVTMPDHMTLTYDFICQTEYTEQMNTIIQKINWAAEEYWGDPNRFKFRVYVGDYSMTTDTPTDNDRVVKSTFTITVHGYLLEESFEDRKLSTQKVLTKRKIVMGTEVVTSVQMEALKQTNKPVKPYPYSYVNGVIKNDNDTFDVPSRGLMLEIADLAAVQKTYENLIGLSAPTLYPSISINIWHMPPPVNSDDYGEDGWMSYDSDYHYIYVNGKWLRHALSFFQPF